MASEREQDKNVEPAASDRIFEKLADDLREIGILILVFLVVDYAIPGSAAVKRTVTEWVGVAGLLSLISGYIVEWRRK